VREYVLVYTLRANEGNTIVGTPCYRECRLIVSVVIDLFSCGDGSGETVAKTCSLRQAESLTRTSRCTAAPRWLTFMSSDREASRKRRSETMVVPQQQQQQQQQILQQEQSSQLPLESSGGCSISNQRRIVVRIKRFHGVAKWSWNANDDVCGICQAAFEGAAPGIRYV
jgi:Anaphase-promoting complex subunit 11 RING-H2 finger